MFTIVVNMPLLAVTLPVTDTSPPVKLAAFTIVVAITLLETTFDVALTKPVIYAPVVANTATFDAPSIVILALLLATGMFIWLVPLAIRGTVTPVSWLPLPRK